MVSLDAPATLTWAQARAFVMKRFNAEPEAWVVILAMDAYEFGYRGGAKSRGKEEKVEERATGLDAGEVPVLSDFWKPTPTSSYWLGALVASAGWGALILLS